MHKHYAKTCVVLLFCLILLIATTGFSNAKSHELGIRDQGTGDEMILFSQLVSGDIELTGPFDSDSIAFSVPAHWLLISGGQLNLSMTIAFNAPGTSSGASQFSPGTLAVELNGVVIGIVSLDQIGAKSQQLQIPDEALRSIREDGLFELRFTLDSGWSCDFNESTFVLIHTNSSMILPHDTITPTTDLTRFPAPIYQARSFLQSSALVVVPDQPSAAELQSALTIAAGLGNLTSGHLKIDVNTIGHLTMEQITNNHLVLVGKAATLPLSDQLNLPMPMSDGLFNNSGGDSNDGIVELVNSPWSVDKVVLIVSGNTDAGTIKAAQAVSTGVLRPNIFPNLAIVDQIQNVTQPVLTSTDQTLKELGYKNEELTEIGINYSEFVFYIPPGQTIADNAYFELLYGHSALLQYELSGIVVRLNGKPIGSVALTAESAQQAVNSVRFALPSSGIITGENVLEIRTNLMPIDRCTNPSLSAVYANIWSDSLFHLPLTQAVISPTANYNLKAYPAPFAYRSTLDTTAFVLPRNDVESWRAALNIAAYLGDRASGPIVSLSAFYGDDLPVAERTKYNFFVIGRPSTLPIIREINDYLPAPFAENSEIAVEPNMQVRYRLSPQTLVGYVQMLLSPWNNDHVILIAVGTTNESVSWAASHLIEPESYQLTGNFAIVTDQKVYSTDTRLATITPSVVSTEGPPPVEIVPPSIDPTKFDSYRPGWLLPVLIVSAILILLIVIVVGYYSWVRGRFSGKSAESKTTDENP